MDQPNVHYDVTTGIARIVLDRPPVNALSLEMITVVVTSFRRAGADDAEDFCNCAMSRGAQEGLTAFIEKRRQNW